MKIIHIILGKANPNRLNGVNKVVNCVANTQTDLGEDVEVWGITKDQRINYPNRLYTTKLFKDRKFKFLVDPKLIEAIEMQDKNTIFHLHGGFIPQFIMVAAKLKALNFDYVITGHGAYNLLALERSKLKKNIYLSLFEKSILNGAKTIHIIGKSEAEGVLAISNNTNIELIPNGQEVINSNIVSLNAEGHFVFGYCGRLDAETKGLRLLLKSFSLISGRHQNAFLHLIGDGPDRKMLQKLAKELGIADKVKFLGALFGKEKDLAFLKMNVFVLLSKNEGLPGVALEAAALGLPLIISEATNLKEAVLKFDAGYCISNVEVNSVANVFEEIYLLNDTERLRTMQNNSLQMIEQAFCWKSISRNLIEMYQAA